MAETDDILAEAKRLYGICQDAEDHNRKTAKDDITFAREGTQWDDKIRKAREAEGRPCLTINKLPAFIRQVVNDARQNKPSIKVHPVDSGADVETADVINGLIRNIEYTSNAEVAYDTATESAVTGGFGYIRVGVGYAYDTALDQDITIDRVVNPFQIYGDPHSKAADSSDWDVAFVVEKMTERAFKAKYKAAVTNWDDADAWGDEQWRSDDMVTVAEYWTREEYDRPVLQLSDGTILDRAEFEADEQLQLLVRAQQMEITRERTAKSHRTKQRFISGAEVLSERDWPGRYIPIIPVYGDEFDVNGKRYFRSLIHNAIDAQRMFNYWRTTSTELVALAPRVPFIGPRGAFDDDDNWQTVNVKSHPYLEYSGPVAPQRQSLDSGPAAGALQEALNASDDMKAIIGLYDASLGARSNETSGRAIMARQREGDVATFHFIDNMARAIRHTGRVILDLLPHLYNTERVIRVIGEDGSERAVTINAPFQKTDPETGKPMVDEMGQAVLGLHKLDAGKYDLTVTTGPSFTTRREEAAYSMTEALRAFPAAAPVIMPELAKNLDWPGADDIAEKLKQQSEGQIPEQVQQLIEEGKAQIAALTEENQKLKGEKVSDQADIAARMQEARMQAALDLQVAQLRIESEERIAQMKIESEARVAAFKAKIMAQNQQNQPAPQRAA